MSPTPSADERLELAETLDFDQPIALSLNALLHFITDSHDPYAIVRRLLDPLPAGSALAMNHCTPDFDPAPGTRSPRSTPTPGTPVQFRSHSEVRRFFDGLDLIDPGICCCHRWRPAEPARRDGDPGRGDQPAGRRGHQTLGGPEAWARRRAARWLNSLSAVRGRHPGDVSPSGRGRPRLRAGCAAARRSRW